MNQVIPRARKTLMIAADDRGRWMIRILLRRLGAATFAAGFIGPVLVPAHAADSVVGPASPGLVITYHTAPANRPALFRELAASGFKRWKRAGIIASYNLLTNRFADAGTWDAMAVLSFATPAAYRRWIGNERTAPAGLSPKALALTPAIDTVPVELVRHGEAKGAPSGEPVILAIPYQVLVPMDEYKSYVDGYVVPQMEGWIQEGVLSSYKLYLASYPAGRPWGALLLLEYKNEEALAARDAVVAAVRAQLANSPEWKSTKKNVRTEKTLVVADPLLPQR